MKKLTSLIILALSIQLNVSSQPCLTNGIDFYHQSQIDSFQINYPNCTEIQGDVKIEGYGITNLNGLNVLTAIGGDFYIWNNNALTSLTGLDNVTSIVGFLWILDNNALTNLTGLGNLGSLSGLNIMYNHSLISLTGLDNLTSIEYPGSLFILDNMNLISLSGLDNLTYIGGFIVIRGNYQLLNITSLGNLTFIARYISINDNDNLTSLTGLDNIPAVLIDSLALIGNASLSKCEVKSVCDYLNIPNGIVNIYGNASGCKSKAEVDSACATVSVGNIDTRDEIIIYPNPAEKELYITTKDGSVCSELNIYNQLGQKVLQDKRPTDVIDVSLLRHGMYVVEVVISGMVIREKLLIK